MLTALHNNKIIDLILSASNAINNIIIFKTITILALELVKSTHKERPEFQGRCRLENEPNKHEHEKDFVPTRILANVWDLCVCVCGSIRSLKEIIPRFRQDGFCRL